MMLIGIDMNGTRIRLVQGPPADYAVPLPLDPYAADTPMILSLANGSTEIGQAGWRLVRREPHLACHGFLPQVGIDWERPVRATAGSPGKRAGEPPALRRTRWRAGQHDLDATAAMEQVWLRLEPFCRKANSLIVGLPSYLSRTQADVIRELGRKAGLPVLGSLPLSMAGALAGYAEQYWSETVVVLDVDDHDLSITEVRAVGDHAHVMDVKHLPQLGFKAWRERLINALSDICVLQSRRDPRSSPQAEQGLFEQLEPLLDACQKGRIHQVGVQTATWYQNIVMQPEQVMAVCAGLTRQFLVEFAAVWARICDVEDNRSLPVSFDRSKAVILATHMMGRLPGLIPAVRSYVDKERSLRKPLLSEDDFGDNLMGQAVPDSDSVIVLGPDAPARAIHALGPYFKSAEAAAEHLELTAPLPKPTSVEIGPARLHYQGQDYLLRERNFYVGFHGAQLLVDEPTYPSGNSRHCEFVFDQRTYILFNRSREVTLVNDCPVVGNVVLHAGDWIRLGYDGPLIRFLGQSSNNRAPLMA